MNNRAADILLALADAPFQSQRVLAQKCGHSLGIVNGGLKELAADGYIDGEYRISRKGQEEILRNSPRAAVILAAGYGMRMVPINTESPKALLKIKGEVLIERLIEQLHQAGVEQIYVIVGFMKESFEYLIDRYGVKLVVNPEYASKNNLHSLALAAHVLDNAYVLPADIWCRENPFRRAELNSWYMVSQRMDPESDVRVNRKRELVCRINQQSGNAMIGIAYIAAKEGAIIRQRLKELDRDSRFKEAFWEESLYQEKKMLLQARVVPEEAVLEINTYEQMREIDSGASGLKSDALETIARVLQCRLSDIQNIAAMKKGMTNRSFSFSCGGKTYIMRIPGEGTDELIDRYQEAAVYRAIRGKGLCDDPVYLDPVTGYKITAFIQGVRCCDPLEPSDLKASMEKLRHFHELGLQVDHYFDLYKMLDFYEALWAGLPSAYADYQRTKENVLSLRPYVEKTRGELVLTHIDAVPDNFLFSADGPEKDIPQLTDWEYAGMQDPHVDIAMFCIYSLYSRQQVDQLIRLYFDGEPERKIRVKIYCYIAICGLLWSNWCEYKRSLGVEFGEYSLCQYRYAKEYYKIAMEEMKEE